MAYKLFVNGDVLPASDLNSAFGTGGWTTYTPTLTNMALGNGTLSASYMQIGKTVFLRLRFTLGSTSTVTGAATFSLPVTATSAAYGVANLNTGANQIGVAVSGTTTVVANAVDTATSYGTQRSTSATLPGTWATGHTISLSITYEAA